MNLLPGVPTGPGSRFRLAAQSGAVGACIGAIVVAVVGLMWAGPPAVTGEDHSTLQSAVEEAPAITGAAPPAPVVVAIPAPDARPTLKADPIADLRDRRLEVPVLGIARDTLRGMFNERRGSSRTHEAIDILAAKGTPVLAVEDGTIAKLFLSDAGGITVYQFDPTNRYAYYYAHLDAYAPGLVDGAAVTRGQTLGYVGVSGNAPKNTPHLHFAIFELLEAKRWWQGTPIDPFEVLKPAGW